MKFGKQRGQGGKPPEEVTRPAVKPVPKPGTKDVLTEGAEDTAVTTERSLGPAAAGVDDGKTHEYSPGQAAALAGEAAAGAGAETESAAHKPATGGKVVALPIGRKAAAAVAAEAAPKAEPAVAEAAPGASVQPDDDLESLFGEPAAPAPEPAAEAAPAKGAAEAETPKSLRETVVAVFEELFAPRLTALEEILGMGILQDIDTNDALDDGQKTQLKRVKGIIEGVGIIGMLSANDESIEGMVDAVDEHDAFIHGHTDEDRAEAEKILAESPVKPSLVALFQEVMEQGDTVDEHSQTLDAAFRPDRARLAKILERVDSPAMVVLVRALDASYSADKKEDARLIVERIAAIAVQELPGDVKQMLGAIAANPEFALQVLAMDSRLTLEQLALPENAQKSAELGPKASRVAKKAQFCLGKINFDELESQAAAKRSPPEKSGGDE